MARAFVPWHQRIPAIRQAIRDLIVREGAGLSQLEVEAARTGPLAEKAARAARSTKRQIDALQDGLQLLDFIEAGGSP
jgi:hypothetical protein